MIFFHLTRAIGIKNILLQIEVKTILQCSPCITREPFNANNIYSLVFLHGCQEKHASNQFWTDHEANFFLYQTITKDIIKIKIKIKRRKITHQQAKIFTWQNNTSIYSVYKMIKVANTKCTPHHIHIHVKHIRNYDLNSYPICQEFRSHGNTTLYLYTAPSKSTTTKIFICKIHFNSFT